MARTLTGIARDYRWIAAKDGIAHVNRAHERTLCGRLPLPIRYAWPATSRCPVCVTRLEEVATARPA